MSAALKGAASEEQTDELLALVRRAWVETLARRADPDLTLEANGADSLTTVLLLLRLEQVLGRKLSFDLFQPDATIRSLARSLASSRPAAPMPTLFMLPGLYGDDPRLARLRRRLADKIRVEMLEPPGLDAPGSLLRDLAATAAIVAREIQRRQPSGDIRLAGFSFGASVAFAAAHHLIASGRTVAMLYLIDGLLDPDMDLLDLPDNFTPRPWPLPLLKRGAIKLAATDRMRWLMLRQVRRFAPPRHQITVRKMMLRHLGNEAIRAWRPTPLALDVNIAVSERYAGRTVPRWRDLADEISVLVLPGRHLDSFEPPAIDVLAKALRQAVEETEREEVLF
jgi:thioesterase domain-containing protein/acyl carrier protein